MFTFMNVDVTVGLAAGVIQLIGYILYWKLVVTAAGKLPNPLTWLMFGYGTILLTVLEFDVGATWDELYLPIVCAICGLGVAIIIWLRSYKATKRRWPKEWTMRQVDLWDGMSLATDYVVTFGYVVAWVVFTWGALNEEGRYISLMVFLFCSNISTVFNFVPILRDTRVNPGHEHWLPWAVWTMSYMLLTIETWNRDGVIMPTSWDMNAWNTSFVDWIWLLIYPVSNMFFHALVSLLALPARQRRIAEQQPCE